MDFQNIKELIKIFDKSALSKLDIKEGEFKICLQKGINNPDSGFLQQNFVANQSSTPSLASVMQVANTEESSANKTSHLVCDINGCTVNAPMVGTFYSSPAPDAPPFIKEGDVVRKGQVICILEAMKIMNEVEAEFDCKIVKFLVEDGSPVEFDMPLFSVERI